MLILKNTSAVLVVFTFVSIYLVNSTDTVQLSVYQGVVTSDDVVAPNSFVRIGSKYYYIEGKEQLNWFAASNKCRSLHADLANIENEQEINALGQWLSAHNYVHWENFWFSANTLGRSDRVFQSSATGLPLRYIRWAPGEPNGDGNESCAHLYQRDGWTANDNDCNMAAHYICQARDPKTIVLTVWDGF